MRVTKQDLKVLAVHKMDRAMSQEKGHQKSLPPEREKAECGEVELKEQDLKVVALSVVKEKMASM